MSEENKTAENKKEEIKQQKQPKQQTLNLIPIINETINYLKKQPYDEVANIIVGWSQFKAMIEQKSKDIAKSN